MTNTPPAANIRAELARRFPGMTQRQVGEAIGLNQKAISRRLRGEVEFSATELQRLAEFLEVPVGTLFGEPARAS